MRQGRQGLPSETADTTMHGFYNGYGQIQPNYYARHPKMQGVFAEENPLPLADISWY